MKALMGLVICALIGMGVLMWGLSGQATQTAEIARRSDAKSEQAVEVSQQALGVAQNAYQMAVQARDTGIAAAAIASTNSTTGMVVGLFGLVVLALVVLNKSGLLSADASIANAQASVAEWTARDREAQAKIESAKAEQAKLAIEAVKLRQLSAGQGGYRVRRPETSRSLSVADVPMEIHDDWN